MTLILHFSLLANGGMSAPFHPMLVNFTAALVPVSFLFDLLGARLGKEQFRAVGWWTLLTAAAVTPFTAVAGWLWMRSMDHAEHGQMAAHQWLGVSLSIGIVALTAWRGWLQRHATALGWTYGAAAVLVVGALLYQAELGASMSFGRGIVLSGESSAHEGGGGGEDHEHAQTQPRAEEHADHRGSLPTTRPVRTESHDHGEQ